MSTPKEQENMEQKYIRERLEDQFNYYDKKSISLKKQFHKASQALIIISASIPFVVTLNRVSFLEIIWKNFPVDVVTALLGTVVAIITGFLSLMKYQEKWVQYRISAEALKQEKYRYLTKTPPYDASNSFDLLVDNVEDILGAEHKQWQSYNVKKSPKPNA